MAGATTPRRPNTKLRAARNRLGLSQEELAARLRRSGAPACSKRQVQRWEAGGGTWPQAHYRQALAVVFDVEDLAELGFHDTATPEDQDPMHRRTLLAGAAGLAAAAAGSEPWARLAYALERAPLTLTPADGDHLLAVTNALYDREALEPAAALAPDLDAHLDVLTGLLRLQLGDELRRTLTLAAGTTATLAGWCQHDLGETRAAHGYWDVAVRAARESGDGPLLACTLAYMSYEAAGRGDHAAAWQLLDTAGEHVRSPAHAQARAWIAARQAEEAAALGDHGPALISLERALTSFDYADPGTSRPWVRFFDSARLGSMAVSTYGLMQHPQTQPAADAVIASLGEGNAKTRAVILSDVATARVRGGDLDAGCDYALQALRATVDQRAILGYQRLAALRPALEQHGDATAVRALLPQLDAAGITGPQAAEGSAVSA